VTHADTSVSEQTLHGVYAVTDGLAPTALGVLADPGVSASLGTGTISVSGSGVAVPVTLDLSDVTEFQITTDTQAFCLHDGDINGDGSNAYSKVDWCDRKLMVSLIGKTISDAEYNPRADFDLDGDIDSTDYAAFLVQFNARACPADYDCSGSVDTLDIFAFLNDWFATAPAADFDGANGVDLLDIYAFLAVYYNGCPSPDWRY
jgi:hypothetical protein